MSSPHSSRRIDALGATGSPLPADPRFAALVLDGLAQPQRRLPTEYLYDARGSALFDAICELPEYYLTRIELAIMRQHGEAMAAAIGPGATVIEYGSGSSIKTRVLLDALVRPAGYVPVDISREHLQQTAARLRREYPGLPITEVVADFTRPLALPAVPQPRVVYFPGSTLGNFEPAAATELLAGMRRLAGPRGAVLVGIDRVKSTTVLEPAYDDAAGVTAEFNLNLLVRINRELGGDFEPMRFRHRARFDAAASRIVMTLVSSCTQIVTVCGRRFALREGEAILTEYSHKYSPQGFAALAAAAGLRVEASFVDDAQWFAVVLLRAA